MLIRQTDGNTAVPAGRNGHLKRKVHSAALESYKRQRLARPPAYSEEAAPSGTSRDLQILATCKRCLYRQLASGCKPLLVY